MIAHLAAWPYAARIALFALVALAATAFASRTDLFLRMDHDLTDTHMRWFARDLAFPDVVLVDVDDDSLEKLQARLGPWPYDRDVYALVHRWLMQAGAVAAGYDMLFAEARNGDAAFAHAIDARAVLAAAALSYTFERDTAYRAQLKAKSWGDAATLHAYAVPDITLPRAELAARGAIGVVSAPVDRDGVLRRVPLLFAAYGQLAPGMALALAAGSTPPPRLALDGGRLSTGARSWPVSDSAEVLLRYPRTMQSLRILPFYQVVLAAAGVPGLEALREAVKGKRVLIGASAVQLGDYVETPAGRMPGVLLQALATQALLSGEVLAPRTIAWTSAGVAGALLMVLVSGVTRWRQRIVVVWGAFPLIAFFLVVFGAVALARGQAPEMLFAASVAGGTHLLEVIFQQIVLFRRNQQLQMEKRAAERADALKSQFLSHITHELRTPLTAIMGFNNINWHGEDIGRGQRMSNSEVVDRNCKHMLSLVNNLLDQAKIEAGQLAIRRHPDRPLEVVEDAVATVRPLLADKPVRLRIDAVDVPAVLDIDAFRLRQILLNLLSNAVKFTEKGEITVVVVWHDGELTLSVVDTGPGMPPEVVQRLFAAFQQADAGIAATHGGTGLGLAISRNLARLMDGDIMVRSTPGRGTVFSLSVKAPRVDADLPPDTAAPMLHGVVLLAEDTEDIRVLVARQLEQLGVSVLQVEDGQQAIEMALEKRPHVVLMDMEMPVMGGAEATRTLRMRGFTAPILALTAHRNEAEHKLALASGCNAVLEKPLARAAMITALSVALAPAHAGN